MSLYPTVSLQPGQSGPEVKKLQEYLVSQGYMAQAEMNTGPGIYGPKTKAAVAKLQQNLGIDTAGYPGYWGPRTLNGLGVQALAKAGVDRSELARYLSDSDFRQRVDSQIEAKQRQAQPVAQPTAQQPISVDASAERTRQLLEQGNILGEQVSKTTGVPFQPTTLPPATGTRTFPPEQPITTTPPTTPTTPSAPTTSLPSQQDDSAIIAMLTKVLDQLTAQNKVINPKVVISDEQILEFLKLAEQEVTPYYQSQLKVAREGIYRDLGYASDEILRNEKQLEKKYGLRVRAIGEEQAERGFALSGRRLEEEQQLREQTAEEIGAGRRKLEFGAGTAARQFAQQYGTTALPFRTLEERPGVVSGMPSFTRTGVQRPLYELSDDVYRGLVGSQEKERLTGIRSLAQQREELTRLGTASPVYSQYKPRELIY